MIYFEYRDNKFGGAKSAPISGNTITQTLTNGNQRINGNYLKQIRADITFVTDNATLRLDTAQVL